MKKYIFLFITALLFMVVFRNTYAISVVPGVNGFGTETRAAYGLVGVMPTIFKITNLNSDGPGSFYECVTANVPRVCIFEISGLIVMKNDWVIDKPYLTIAGQTAPTPGITLKGGKLAIETHDILIQHIKVRPGDTADSPCIRGADNCDGVDINDVYQYLHGGPSQVYNVVIDHASFSWSTDEILSTWYSGVHDVSITNSIFSEGLYESFHPKGPHGYGPLIGKDVKNVLFWGNLFAHFQQRNPLISSGSESILANNVIYNYGIGTSMEVKNSKINIEGNVYIPGPNSSNILPIYPYGGDGTAQIFVADNKWNGNVCDGQNRWNCVRSDNYVKSITAPVAYPANFSILPTLLVESSVFANVGARPFERDPIDSRIINNAKNRTGTWIDCIASSPNHVRTGTAEGGSDNSILLDNNSNKDNLGWAADINDWYNGMSMTMNSGTCSGQTRTISDYVGSSKTAVLNQSWNSCVPAQGDAYSIVIDCSLRNAGGWPSYIQNYRELNTPANPHDDSDGDGYTNLEEWLQIYAANVENGAPLLENYSLPDFIVLAANWLKSVISIADTNNDGVVDIKDLGKMMGNWQ